MFFSGGKLCFYRKQIGTQFKWLGTPAYKRKHGNKKTTRNSSLINNNIDVNIFFINLVQARGYTICLCYRIYHSLVGMKTDWIYHSYYICFHISNRIRILIRIVSAMPDRIRFDVDIINMRFEYSDTDKASDVEYPYSDINRSEPL